MPSSMGRLSNSPVHNSTQDTCRDHPYMYCFRRVYANLRSSKAGIWQVSRLSGTGYGVHSNLGGRRRFRLDRRLLPGRRDMVANEKETKKQESKCHGTSEWSVKTVNCCTGCSHDCRYCYAKEMGIRFRWATEDLWPLERIRQKDVDANLQKIRWPGHVPVIARHHAKQY